MPKRKSKKKRLSGKKTKKNIKSIVGVGSVDNSELSLKSDYNDIKKFLKNDNLRNLLLYGIAESNSFTVNKEAATAYIEQQYTPRKRSAAEALIKTHKYITYKEFIKVFHKLVENMFIKLNKKRNKEYIILTENKGKSGFFCTMIFLFIVKNKIQQGDTRYYYPNDIIQDTIPTDKYKDYMDSLFNCAFANYIIQHPDINIIDINDADYSSNQTVNILSRIGLFFTSIQTDILYNTRASNIHHDDISFIYNNILTIKKSFKNRYILRCFTNSYAISQIKNIHSSKHKNPFYKKYDGLVNVLDDINYVYGKKLETLKEIIYRMYQSPYKIYRDLILFFGGCSESAPSLMNVYFDHKIADWASTVSMSLTIGLIPNNEDYYSKNIKGITDDYCTQIENIENKKYTNDSLLSNRINGKDSEPSNLKELRNDFSSHESKVENDSHKSYILPLINNCKYDIIDRTLDNVSSDNYNSKIFNLKQQLDDNQLLRCPYAWYKKIDYKNGTVNLSDTRIKTIKEQLANNRGNQLAMNGTYQPKNLSKFMSFYM